MNFQRGLAPKEAIGIGQVAIAIEIEAFYTLDPSDMITHTDGRMTPRKVPLSDSYTIKALINIKDGKPERKLRFYGFLDSNGKEHRLSEFKGLYVKFKDTTYKIQE